jgi:hypothetical protein
VANGRRVEVVGGALPANNLHIWPLPRQNRKNSLTVD